MLKQRVITAIILIPIILAAVYFLPPPYFCLFTALIALGGAWEWTNLMQIKTLARRWIYLLVVAFVFFYALFIPVKVIFIVAFIWWIYASILVIYYPRGSFLWGKSVFLQSIMGICVLLPCWTAINFIRNQNEGLLGLLFLFVLVWGADSAAYFVGKKWGTTKLAKQVSPGKSWQGLIGALIVSILITLITLWLCQIPFLIWPFAVSLSLVTVLFSVMGDLFESMMKRQAGLKDSGNLLPGHGGLLDRIDSLTAAAPLFVLGALLLGEYL
jgi:phosphatidate cytidylyltransferase